MMRPRISKQTSLGPRSPETEKLKEDFERGRGLRERREIREMPQAESPEDEMAAEPWFAVGPDDIFPEEFARFLGVDGALREAFLDHHQDLLTATWWRQVQERVAAGEMIDIFPYQPEQRLGLSSGNAQT